MNFILPHFAQKVSSLAGGFLSVSETPGLR